MRVVGQEGGREGNKYPPNTRLISKLFTAHPTNRKGQLIGPSFRRVSGAQRLEYLLDLLEQRGILLLKRSVDSVISVYLNRH